MPDRHCGSCTLCCRLLPVRELDKPANTKCEYQNHKGCRIYRQPGFPPSCHLWSCRWLLGDDTADMLRPDRAGYVLDLMPDVLHLNDNDTGEVRQIEIVQVWVESGCDPLSDKRLRRYAERQAKRGAGLLLRQANGKATAMFGPALASDGKWHIISDDRMQRVATKTGNLLLDTLKQQTVEPDELDDNRNPAC